MKILDKMQRRAAIWILGAFKTSPTEDIEAIARIIPIKFHLQKLARRSQIQPFALPINHIISIVATTHWNGTCDILTSAKLSVGYLIVGITRELNKEPSLHCYPIYISYKWSVLQQCVYLMSTPQ